MIRVGLIGTGNISGVHLGYLKSRQDVEIAALCDIKPENLERRRREFGGEPFGDFRAMLDETKLDAVYLCTPPLVRREMLLACAKRGIPVFCEKPAGRDERAAARLAREIKAARGRVMVGYVFRAMPVVQRLREAMADDVIDAVQSFYGCPMGKKRSWFSDKTLSGGTLVDQATHNLDLMRYLFGEVKEVRGLAANPAQRKAPGYTIEEIIGLSLRFAAGPVAVHLHSWLAESWRNEIALSGRKRFYRIKPADGTLIVEDGAETRSFQQDRRSIYSYEGERFLKMVGSGDWSGNICDFADAVASLRLTLACDRALEAGAVRL
ncbi:MAG: Gfo/Idh/MocA family oxidoreductase [Candidatus Brocadiia bacterium]|jgi:predicted dehydrogenase